MRELCLLITMLMGCSGGDGPAGPGGPTGPLGPTGDPGTAGTMGAEGATGPTGDPGTKGNMGAMGTMGTMGTMGAMGTSVGIAALNPGDANCPYGGTSLTVGATVSYACNGAPGTFSGSFSGGATFSGPTALNGTTTFNGLDVFNEAMQGRYFAVEAQLFGEGLWCGPAPASFNVNSDASPSAAYGRLLTTFEGQLFQNPSAPLPATCVNSAAPNYCFGPVTYFLINPGVAKTISIPLYLDDGPSFLYVDGNLGANKFITTPINATSPATVNIPAGAFALSAIACSNNGPSLALQMQAKFITTNGLQLDYDRTFHHGL